MASQGVILHEWLFNGAKEYIPGKIETTNIIVGAGDLRYATDLNSKTKLGYDFLAKSGIMFNGKYYPHPFYQAYDGSFNKEISAQYKKKVGGKWLEYGSKSKIKVVSYKDNPYAGQGSRNSVMVDEEIGMWKGFLKAQEANLETMRQGTVKFGSSLKIGCVCAGTKIYTNEGRVINIEELKKEDGILGYDSDGTNKQTINLFKPKEIKPCYKISLNDGNYIECSKDHPLLMIKRHFYKYSKCDKIKRGIYQEAKYIKVKDQLLVPGKINIFGSVNIEYARELGLMIGDGNCSENSTPSLSVADKEIYNYIISKYKVSTSKEYTLSNNEIYRQLLIKDLTPYMIKHDLYGRVELEKRLPKDIHTFNKQSISELLAGYFDADGNIYYNKNKKQVRIVLTSIVEELLYEVKYQLLKFGIHCSIYKENRNTIPSEEYKGQLPYICRLYITKQKSIQLFKDNIPILIEKKINNLQYIKYSKYKNFDIDFEINPLNNKEGYFSNSKIEDLTYVTVTKVEYIGKKEVYNLNCGPNHNYISNTLITRQTGGSMEGGTLDAYRMFYDPLTYDLLDFEDTWESKGKIAMFISATKRPNQFKDGEGNTDELKATEYFLKERERLKNSKNGIQALNAHIQYNPLVPSEIFLRSSGNIFPTTEVKAWLSELETDKTYEDAEMICDLIFNSEGEVEPRINSDLVPIREFPLSGKSNADTSGAVVIWYHPETDGYSGKIAWGRYLACLDPYTQEDAGRGRSLGSLFIYDKITNNLVAEYTGRPTTLYEFYERCRKLLIYYNAQCMYENMILGTKQHFEHKNSLRYLMFQPAYIKDVIPGSKVDRGYGMHMNEQLRDHGLLLFRDWLTDEDEPGRLNLRKVRSIPLLQEIVLFDFDTNVDRISSMILLMYAIKEKHKEIVEEAKVEAQDTFFDRRLFQKR